METTTADDKAPQAQPTVDVVHVRSVDYGPGIRPESIRESPTGRNGGAGIVVWRSHPYLAGGLLLSMICHSLINFVRVVLF